MNLLKNMIKGIQVLTILTTAALAQENHIYCLMNDKNVGEQAQVKGIGENLKILLSKDEHTVVLDQFDDKQYDTFKKTVAEKSDTVNKIIVIASGESGIEKLNGLKPQKNLVLVYSAHQWNKRIFDLQSTHFIALPDHTVTKELLTGIASSTELVQTVGVAHDLTGEKVMAAYNANTILPSNKSYIGVILGGDAPDTAGKILFYTANEAKKLAQYLGAYAKDQHKTLIILNGPRTGAHHPDTGADIPNSHADGKPDFVTQAFIDTLQAQHLQHDTDYVVFDFQKGQKSAFNEVLGLLDTTTAELFVAGESTSMVSQAIDCLPKGKVIIVANNAMNDNHRAHMQSENQHGRASILQLIDEKWTMTAGSTTVVPTQQSAAQQIAAKIAATLK